MGCYVAIGYRGQGSVCAFAVPDGCQKSQFTKTAEGSGQIVAMVRFRKLLRKRQKVAECGSSNALCAHGGKQFQPVLSLRPASLLRSSPTPSLPELARILSTSTRALVLFSATPTAIEGRRALGTLAEKAFAAVVQRHIKKYFTPLLRSSSLGQLRLRLLATKWGFFVENRAFNLALFTAEHLKYIEWIDAEALGSLYEDTQKNLLDSPFNEDTKAYIDYALFTILRTQAQVIQNIKKSRVRQVEPSVLLELAKATSATELYSGTLFLAASDPTLVRNPTVFASFARDAVEVADTHLRLLVQVGFLSED